MSTLQLDRVTIAIPSDIEQPQFKLFDRVRVKPPSATGNRHRHNTELVGTVVGLEFTAFTTALKEDSDYVGWSYVVDWVMGASTEQALTVSEAKETWFEHAIELAE